MAAKIAVALAAPTVGAVIAATPASAHPGVPPCGAMSAVCGFLPMMPDLDHDLDLSTQNPQVPADENLPPADVCALGCV
jgi:hypothetical protein